MNFWRHIVMKLSVSSISCHQNSSRSTLSRSSGIILDFLVHSKSSPIDPCPIPLTRWIFFLKSTTVPNMPQGLSLLHTITYIFHLLPSLLFHLPFLSLSSSMSVVVLSIYLPLTLPPSLPSPSSSSLSGPTVYPIYRMIHSPRGMSQFSIPFLPYPWLSMPLQCCIVADRTPCLPLSMP